MGSSFFPLEWEKRGTLTVTYHTETGGGGRDPGDGSTLREKGEKEPQKNNTERRGKGGGPAP